MAKRAYENKYPSVTEVLGILRKPALEFWFKYNSAKFCDEESKKGKITGTQIHDAIEQYIKTGEAKVESEYADEVTNGLNSFILFSKENPDIKMQFAEIPLTSEIHKFNGTIDAIAGDLLMDWKGGTAKDKEKPPIYDEFKIQVSSYTHLYNEVKGTNIQTAMIAVFAKDKIAYNTYTLNKEEIDNNFNEVFLPALRILNYQKRSK
jgi:hypothetical protein